MILNQVNTSQLVSNRQLGEVHTSDHLLRRPSDLDSNQSANEWHEVLNYQRELDEEKIIKEKEAKVKKIHHNKQNLEQQLAEKKQRMLREKEDQKQFELMLLQKGKERQQ